MSSFSRRDEIEVVLGLTIPRSNISPRAGFGGSRQVSPDRGTFQRIEAHGPGGSLIVPEL